MKRETYDLIRSRVSIYEKGTKEYEELKKLYDERGYVVPADAVIYRFNADGLGEDAESFIQPIRTKNMWNICERVYSVIKNFIAL